MANNSAASGGGVYKDERGTLKSQNSIIAGSTDGDCIGGLDQNINNLIQDNSCSPALSGNPKLGALTGSPAYYPLLSDSPVINAANADHCTATDQFGTTRPQGAACDIGAYELPAASIPTATLAPTETSTPTETPTPLPFNVTLNGTACHLHDAITAANSETATGSCPAGSGADTISLLANINLNTASAHAGAPYYLTQIKSAITIQGNGYTISGHGTGLREDSGYSFFYMFPGASSLTLNNVTIRNGSQVVRNSGGTVNITNSTIENIWDETAISSGNFTSRIIEPGRTFIATLTISNTTIRNVEDHFISRERGGGAIVVGPGNVSISNNTISNNLRAIPTEHMAAGFSSTARQFPSATRQLAGTQRTATEAAAGGSMSNKGLSPSATVPSAEMLRLPQASAAASGLKAAALASATAPSGTIAQTDMAAASAYRTGT